MLRRLLFALAIAATLPGFRAAAAQEVTWQDVAQSMFIVVGKPVPYESELLSEDDLQNRRVVQVKNPTYLKGGESDVPVLLMMVPYELVLWNQPTIFFLRSFSIQEAGGRREIYGDVSWYGYEGMFNLDYGPAPRLYSQELAERIESLIAQNEHYREIGAAYEPAEDDPLLAEIKNDLQEIAKPIDFSKGVYKEEIAPHSLAIRRLLYRGEDIVPRLVSLLDFDKPFPAGSIIADPTHFDWTGIGPPPSADNMAEAIDVLLGYWSGFVFGYHKSISAPEHTIGLWQTYLGYQLAGIDPTQPGEIDWRLLAEESELIIEGMLAVAENPLDRDIYDYGSAIWWTLSNPRFLKGEDQGGPYRFLLNEHWIRRAKNIEGKVVAFSAGSRINSNDHQRIYDLVRYRGQSQIHPSARFDYDHLDALLTTSPLLYTVVEPSSIDLADPYWANLRDSLENAASAYGKEELNVAVQRVVEYGEPAIPYLITLLDDEDPWPYGKIFEFLEEPWRGDPPTFGAENWERFAAEFLRLIAEQPLSRHPLASYQEGAALREQWSNYLTNRLATPEGRLALSHDPKVSKAEALRRAIRSRLKVGATRGEVAAFFISQGIEPFYDEISYYGEVTPRFQALVPDANPADDVDETVVLHVFLDKSFRMIGSDVRYLFDLYR